MSDQQEAHSPPEESSLSIQVSSFVEPRLEKVRRYLVKKYKRNKVKKYTYTNHSHAADTRLRIEGRFISKEKAIEILGLDNGALLDKSTLQELLNMHNTA